MRALHNKLARLYHVFRKNDWNKSKKNCVKLVEIFKDKKEHARTIDLNADLRLFIPLCSGGEILGCPDRKLVLSLTCETKVKKTRDFPHEFSQSMSTLKKKKSVKYL